jgi:hypothetical protein
MNLKGFIKQCHKKEVFKMLSIYIVSSWVLLQVLSVIADPIGLPKKSVTYLIVILLMGLPIYIYYVWKFKLLKYEIQQTEDPNTPYNKSAFQKMYFSSLFVVALVSGISITLIIKNSLKNNFSLEKIESNNKIAVLEFENTTTNEKLSNVGKIASNWIIHGITENKLGQVISPKLVNDYTSILKSTVGTADLNNLLKNYFKPDKVIEGVYYVENDQLFLQGSIKDGLIDKTLISFETITCDPNSPLDCAEKLKQEILGYLSTVGKQDNLGYIQNNDSQTVSSYYEETPPNYEAYQYLLNAYENRDNDKIYLELLNKSIATDPSFFEPKIHKISHYYNSGNFKIADSLREAISINSKLNNRQRNWMLFYEAILSGKNDKVYRAIKDEYKNAYKDLTTNMTTMTIALQYVNRPEDIEAIYDEIPMKDLILENCSRCGFRYYLKGLADVELGNYANVIKTILPITNIIEDNYLKRPLISAFVKSGRYAELEKYLSDYALIASPQDINYLKVFTGIQLINSDQSKEANKYFNEIILSNNSTLDLTNLAHAFYFIDDYINAKNLYKKLIENDPLNVDYLVRLAISEYSTGNIDDAKANIKKLESLRTDYQFGSIDYSWGQYFAVIGDIDKAIQYLEKAVAQGYNYTPSTFQNDPHFKTVKERPEFSDRIMNYWKNKTL